MPMSLRATLVTDGSSDIVLVPMLRWLVFQLATVAIEIQWADLRLLRKPPRGLAERLAAAVKLSPCEILFIHRDAENQDPALRYDEIRAANQTAIDHVCIVPVRMQEAWLLHNEMALREAAGRPSGRELLNLPRASAWEQLADPKQILHEALIRASGASGRRAKNFKPAQAAHRLAELVEDWSPLRQLVAFRQLEEDTRSALARVGAPLTS